MVDLNCDLMNSRTRAFDLVPETRGMAIDLRMNPDGGRIDSKSLVIDLTRKYEIIPYARKDKTIPPINLNE